MPCSSRSTNAARYDSGIGQVRRARRRTRRTGWPRGSPAWHEPTVRSGDHPRCAASGRVPFALVGEEGEATPKASASPPDDASIAAAQADAADIVRLAFAQAERINAPGARRPATRRPGSSRRRTPRPTEILAERARRARAPARRRPPRSRHRRGSAPPGARRGRARGRGRPAAGDRAGSTGGRDPARRLTDGAVARTRRGGRRSARTAERDAEAIVAAATLRARATSAELLAATRRRLGEATAAPSGEPPAHDGPRTAAAGRRRHRRPASTGRRPH